MIYTLYIYICFIYFIYNIYIILCILYYTIYIYIVYYMIHNKIYIYIVTIISESRYADMLRVPLVLGMWMTRVSILADTVRNCCDAVGDFLHHLFIHWVHLNIWVACFFQPFMEEHLQAYIWYIHLHICIYI